MTDTHNPQSTAGGFTSPDGDPSGNITRGFQATSVAQISDETSESPNPVITNEVKREVR